MAQETKPGEEIMIVSPGLKYAMESYWRYYREDDWENLYRSMHITRNKEEFIAEKKRIKANSPLGFKAILEVALSDKMTFISKLNRARIQGCAKILWQDGKSQWVDIYSFADNIGDDWIVSSAVTFYKQPDDTLKPCSKNPTSLPIKIKAAR
jgi:hypothetical protein